jgi:hypothetical protein
MIVPAAGAVLAIIEGLQAAWGTVSRVIQAFDRFMGFLKAVKTGQSGPQFGAALAAAGVVLIDFVSNWLLKRVRGAASKVAAKVKEIAKKIGRKLKAASKKLGGKFGQVKDKFFGKEKGDKGKGKESDHHKDKDNKDKATTGASVKLNFSMNGEPHNLTLISGSTGKVLMASSNPGVLSGKISEALNKLNREDRSIPTVPERIRELGAIKLKTEDIEKILHNTAASKEDKKKMKKMGNRLVSSISRYADKFGVHDIDEILKTYPAPVVGLYGQIRRKDKTPLPDGTTREAHHAPPYELAQTFSTELKMISKTLIRNGVIDNDNDPFLTAAGKIDAAGENGLPAILVHSTTHRQRGAGSRIHGSEIRAELQRRLGGNEIESKEGITTMKNELAVKAENKTYKRYIDSVEAATPGNSKKKLKIALQDTNIDTIKEIFKKAYDVAALQTLEQVQIAIEGSKFDGPKVDRDKAMLKLRNQAEEVWKNNLLKSIL